MYAPTGAGSEYLRFNILTPAGSITDALVINKSGNVGIGTTTPMFKLEIADSNAGGTKQGLRLGALNTSAAENYDIYRYANDGSLYNVGNQSGIGSFVWQTNSGSGVTSRMTLTNAGNVGIGTTSPVALLGLWHRRPLHHRGPRECHQSTRKQSQRNRPPRHRYAHRASD